MKLWQRRTLGILSIGGGCIGITAATGLLASQNLWLNNAFIIMAILLYAWGLWCGAMLYEGREDWLNKNLIFWAIQIPSFSSPYFSYAFSSGAEFINTIGLQSSNDRLDYSFQLGSHFKYNVIDANEPVSVGVNLFAVIVVLFLSSLIKNMRSLKKQPGASA